MKRFFIIMIFVGSIASLVLLSYSRLFSESGQNAKEAIGDKLFIGHTEIFGSLERPPVLFDHGLHEKKSKEKGCRTCHPLDVDRSLVFKFPFSVAAVNRNTVKDAYHDKCISCHSRLIEEGKKHGPITCGECHDRQRSSERVNYSVFDFDFVVHEKHVEKLNKKCDDCHHFYDKEGHELVYELGTEQSCYYCHDLDAKRGPALSTETEITRRKRLSIQRVCHDLCVNCHLFYSLQDKKAGPLECRQCHTGKYRTLSQLAAVPRPYRDQPKKSYVSIKGAKMKRVLFDHESHERNARTCRGCHHETLNACKECHSLSGNEEGRRITVADAYHDISSQYSCAGCHSLRKANKDCSGCHRLLHPMDTQSSVQKKESCLACHNGKKGQLPAVLSIPVSSLNSEKVPDKVTVKVLEKIYEPSEFPHRKIVKRLVDISNKDKMATYFHRNIQTICEGCHHRRSEKAEAREGKPPYCRNCHAFFFDAKNLNKPRLLAAYHRQCLGCHQQMKMKQQGCADCHKEKIEKPKDIL